MPDKKVITRNGTIPHRPSIFNSNKNLLTESRSNTVTEDLYVYPYDIKSYQVPFDSSKDFHVNHLRNIFNDVARPNLFKIKIVPPRPLMKDWGETGSSLMALAKSTKIPSITIKEWTYERAGQKLHIPTNEVDHGDASITFTNDSDFAIRSMFNRWMKLALINWEYNLGSVPSLALQGSVYIYHYDTQLKPTYMVKLTNAWPSSLSEIELSQDSENTAEEFTVDFKYTTQEIYKDFKG